MFPGQRQALWPAAAAIVFLLPGCGGGPKPNAEPTAGWEVTVVANGDTVDVTDDGKVPLAPYPPTDAAAAPTASFAPGDYVYGYRIQLLATSSMKLAEGELGRADSLFTWPTYVEYEPPFYKVRLGDFYTKGDAETVRTDIQPQYPEAWVVQTMVPKP